jgi:hypothetical protein
MANLSMKIKDEKHLALKHLAVDKNTSVTALVEEAIDLLFAMESGKTYNHPKGKKLLELSGPAIQKKINQTKKEKL